MKIFILLVLIILLTSCSNGASVDVQQELSNAVQEIKWVEDKK